MKIIQSRFLRSFGFIFKRTTQLFSQDIIPINRRYLLQSSVMSVECVNTGIFTVGDKSICAILEFNSRDLPKIWFWISRSSSKNVIFAILLFLFTFFVPVKKGRLYKTCPIETTFYCVSYNPDCMYYIITTIIVLWINLNE